MRVRHRYMPIGAADVGMVLGAPVSVVERGILSLTLPVGHALTEENLQQLNARHAEFIFVDEPDTRTDEQVGEDAASAAGRVMHLFEGVDLTDPNMAALFDQVLLYRSA